MRTALYLRVSTAHQKPDLQADGMRRYAARADLDIVAQYLDVALSGRKEGRPQLQALMRAARNHEFACVLVWKLESALISERVRAGMAAARTRGKPVGRPATPTRVVERIEALASSTDLSIRQIQGALKGRVSRSVVGAIVKRVRE